jgi:hypothetical protein
LHITQKLKNSLAWNAFESIFYQILLCIHQLALYKSVTATHYGYIGTALAITYLVASGLLLGLESAITPFLHQALSSKDHFKKIIIRPLIKQIFLLSLLGAGAVVLNDMGIIWTSIRVPFSYPFLALMGILALSEGLRKFFRTLLQLMFQARMIAVVELVLLLGYFGLVWGCFISGYELTTHLIFIPLLITSCIANCLYGLQVLANYRSLKNNTTQIPRALHTRIIHSRIINAFNSIGHMICSANFLIPIFAAIAGFEAAALFKLISYWCYIITPIMQRIFGLSSQALFATLKEYPVPEKLHVVSLLNKYLFNILSILFCAIVLTSFIISWLNGGLIELAHWIMLSSFIVLLLSENIIIVYEKYWVAEEMASLILMYQSSTFFAWYLCVQHFCFSPNALLISLLITRLMSCWLLAFLSQEKSLATLSSILYKITSRIMKKTI